MTYSKLLRTMFEGDPLGMEQQVDFEQMYGDPSNLHLTPKLHPASETEQPDPGAEGMAAPTDYAGAMMPPGAPGGDMGQPGAMPPGGMPSPDQMQQIQPGMQPQQQPGMQENVMKDDLDLYLDALLDESVDELTEGPFDYEGPNPGGYPAQRGFYAGGGQPAYAGRPAAPGGGGFGWETQNVPTMNYGGFQGQRPPPSVVAGGPAAVSNWQQQARAVSPSMPNPYRAGVGFEPPEYDQGRPTGRYADAGGARGGGGGGGGAAARGDAAGGTRGAGAARGGGGGGGGGAAAASAGRAGGDPATREIQQNLVKQGYDIGKTGVDGIMGPRTQAAVQARNTAQNNGVAQNRAAGAGPFDREKDLSFTRTTMGTGQNLPGGGGAADREKDQTPTTSKMAGEAGAGEGLAAGTAAAAGGGGVIPRIPSSAIPPMPSARQIGGMFGPLGSVAGSAVDAGKWVRNNVFGGGEKEPAAAAAPAAAAPAAAAPAAAAPAAAPTQGLSFKGGTIGDAADSVRNSAGVKSAPAGPPAAQPAAGPARMSQERKINSGTAPPTSRQNTPNGPIYTTPISPGTIPGDPRMRGQEPTQPATPAPAATPAPSAPAKITPSDVPPLNNSKDWGLDWSDYNLLYESDRATDKKIRGY